MTNSDKTPSPEGQENLPKPKGVVGWALLWLLGIPVPILLVVFVLRGCT